MHDIWLKSTFEHIAVNKSYSLKALFVKLRQNGYFETLQFGCESLLNLQLLISMINSIQFPTTIETLKHAAPIDNVHVDSRATIHMKTQNIGSHDVPYIHLFMEFECTNGKDAVLPQFLE